MAVHAGNPRNIQIEITFVVGGNALKKFPHCCRSRIHSYWECLMDFNLI